MIVDGRTLKVELAKYGACDPAQRFFGELRDDDSIDAIFAVINDRMPPAWAFWCRRTLGHLLTAPQGELLCRRAAADPEWAWNAEREIALTDAEREIVRAAWVPFYPARAEEMGA